MIRLLGALFVTLALGGPFALLWWAIDDEGTGPLWLLFFIGWLTFVLWPEPRRVRRRTARMTQR